MVVGDIRVTFLPDGIHHVRPLAEYPGSTPELWASHAHLLDADGWLVMSVGSFLIETGGQKLLVDAGFGPRETRSVEPATGEQRSDLIGGRMLDSLAEANCTPEDIDGILFSHLHVDHVGWVCTASDNKKSPTFVNAVYYVGMDEWKYWTGQPVACPGSPGTEQNAVLKESLFLVDDGYSFGHGVTVVATPGHTPGHCSFMVSSGTERMMILGDAIHNPIEFEYPELKFAFEFDPAQAAQSRGRITTLVDNANTTIAGGHFADRIFCRLMPAASSRRQLSFSEAHVIGNR